MSVRLNKYLSECGICSRREADRLILSGDVTVDGEKAVLGMKVREHDTVAVGGKRVSRKNERVLLVFNKPPGVVCTSDRREKDNIISYINYPQRITYAGRLDKDSEGLILMTNDGDIIDGMMRSRNMHEKEYEVEVDRPVTEDFLRLMARGVCLSDTVTRPCKVRKLTGTSFDIILTQGLNRQIRRMCEAFGYKVIRLLRVRIMNIRLGDLKSGDWREVTPEEMSGLMRLIKSGDGLI